MNLVASTADVSKDGDTDVANVQQIGYGRRTGCSKCSFVCFSQKCTAVNRFAVSDEAYFWSQLCTLYVQNYTQDKSRSHWQLPTVGLTKCLPGSSRRRRDSFPRPRGVVVRDLFRNSEESYTEDIIALSFEHTCIQLGALGEGTV